MTGHYSCYIDGIGDVYRDTLKGGVLVRREIVHCFGLEEEWELKGDRWLRTLRGAGYQTCWMDCAPPEPALPIIRES